MKCTFKYTEHDNFNEIYCSIIYLGICRRVRWWVNKLTLIHNIIVLDTTDYITFYIENDSDHLSGPITWNPTQQYISITSNSITNFNNADKTDIHFEQTDVGTY